MPFDLPSPVQVLFMQEARACDSEAVLAAATQARLSGRHADARAELEGLVRAEPGNADAWLQLGFVYSAAGETARAEAAFLHTLSLAPDYDDARLGLARLAYRSGDFGEAGRWLASVSPARTNDTEAEDLRRALDAARREAASWRLDLASSYSALSDDLQAWREGAFSMTRRDGRLLLGAGLEYAERFDRSDLYGEARVGYEAWGAALALAFGGAPDADFRPRQSLRFDADSAGAGPWALGASLTSARYAAGDVAKVDLRLGWRANDAVALRAAGVLVDDESGRRRGGYALGGAWTVGPGFELSLGWADTPETSEGVTVDVRSISLGAAFDVAAGARMRVGVASEDRETFERNELSFAVTRTF